jgi:hypothetical protein
MVLRQVAFVLVSVGVAFAAGCGGDSRARSSGVGGAAGGVTGGKGGASGAFGKGGGGNNGTSGGAGGRGGAGGGEAGAGREVEAGAAGSAGSGTPSRGGRGGSGGTDHLAGGAGESGGVAGEAGSDAGEPGGAAGEAGDGGGGPLAGYRVLFVGSENIRGNESEAELHRLIVGETGVEPSRIHADPPAQPLAAEDLASADIVVIDALTRAYDAEEATVAADWVRAGHGIVILSGYRSDPERENELAAACARRFVPNVVWGDASSFVIPLINPVHPIMEGVSSLRFNGGRPIYPSNAIVLAYGPNQPGRIGTASEHDAGRVVLWGDDEVLLSGELNRRDTQGAYPGRLFWTNLLRWVARPR